LLETEFFEAALVGRVSREAGFFAVVAFATLLRADAIVASLHLV
jgi:hypothetical protein